MLKGTAIHYKMVMTGPMEVSFIATYDMVGKPTKTMLLAQTRRRPNGGLELVKVNPREY
jgi:hypothetical protein